MPRQLAILVCFAFVLWLFARERKGRPPVSAALWLPMTWMAILGSRPISLWFGLGRELETTEDYLEGSPVDRAIFLILILAAGVALVRRRVNWRAVFIANRWVIIYFLYLGLSVLWSDYTMTAFKRWVKDVGSVLMVLIILTEENPLQALKTTFLRCSYVLIPFSVLFIKYLPELGRGYDTWTYEVINIGVTTNKNMLGMSLFVCGLTLFWTVLDKWKEDSGAGAWRRFVGELILALMVVWLLRQAHSATAVACTILGSGILIATMVSAIRRKLQRAAAFVVAAVLLFVLVGPMLGLDEMLVGLLGRDMTFTGRTDIWKSVLAEDINPLLGVGHYSFWLGERVERVSRGYFYLINEAHNGYLEVYLNSGLIGLGLLLTVLVSAWRKNMKEAMAGDSAGGFGLSVLVGIILYGLTEAVFRFGFISSSFLAVAMADPCAPALKPLEPFESSSQRQNTTPSLEEESASSNV